jgi:hypothetical protein
LPQGPFGKQGVGVTLDPSLTFQGFAPGASSPSTVHLSDLNNCDGSHPDIHAIVVDSSAVWCGPCQQVAQDFVNLVIPQGWGPNGVKIFTVVVENASHQPAAVSDAQWWLSQFKETTGWVSADPNQSFLEAGAHQIPRLMLVDAKKFKVIDEIAGLQQAFIDEANQYAKSH